MKKRALCTIWCTLVQSLLLINSVPARAQVSNPSTWNTFVNSPDNPIVSDTFRIQTFDDVPANNWIYSTSGRASIINARKEGLGTPGSDKSLKLLPGSSASFSRYSLEKYSDVYIMIRFGDKVLSKGENMTANTYRTEGEALVTLRAVNEVYTPSPFRLMRIGKNPPQLDLTISPPAAESRNGFYCIDSLYACGSIPLYSLFTGKGNWNDTICWTHLPAGRHRNALVQGEITVNGEIRNNTLALNNGSLDLAENAHLCINNITLHESSSLYSSGNITIQERVIVTKTFPQKGVWYFIAFPFDVYAADIDSRFHLKDETFSGSGNYFYVQTYNEEKRAQNNASTGNWEVVSSYLPLEDRPLFRKNKGYLIALDAKATDQTLTFSSKAGVIPTDFGRNGNISISVSSTPTSAGSNHKGWYLCGNPLPAPLALSQIEQNPDTDGHIYLYTGSGYTAYAIGSNYVLPPYSAFFVKASADTELHVTNKIQQEKGQILDNSIFTTQTKIEPEMNSTSAPSLSENRQIQSCIIGKEVHLVNIPGQGYIQVMDLTGHIVFHKSVPAGSSKQSLSCKPGLYILKIEAGHYRAHYKCTITG